MPDLVTRLNSSPNSQLNATSPSEPRFGWANHGHHTINKKAINEMPDHSWKAFLQKNLRQINTYNDFQDDFHQNQYHTIILDPKTMAFSESSNYGKTEKQPSSDSWARIQEQYSPNNHRQYIVSAQTAYPKVVPGRHAIFAAQHMLASLVDILKQINNNYINPKNGRAVSPEDKELVKHHLLDRLGVVTHLVADMVTPLHTSNPHNWPLGRQSKWGTHHFLETAFFKKPEDYGIDKLGYPPDNYRPLKDKSAIETYLCKYVSRAAEKVFQIVKCQKRVDASLPSSTTTAEYEAELTKCFKPLMQEQAYSASKIISRLLHTVWVHAGKPDLSLLDANLPQKTSSPNAEKTAEKAAA